jgi:tRNA nucleotidyltransferase (CCA-adding enzyme)
MFKELTDKTYAVGGSVRDELLNLEVSDYDFVTVATKEEFEKVFPEASLVGKDFPVYLVKGHEVALSRTEKSTGNGYGDFALEAVGVSIEDDLKRRDFTINSMAIDSTNKLVDPFGGQADLEQGLLRTVFVEAFEEDPVRILRGARFAARFGFKIEPETKELMSLAAPKLINVTKERIVKELEKMYESTDKPSAFFEVLSEIGALEFIFPDLERLNTVTAGPSVYHLGKTAFGHTMFAVDTAKALDAKFHIFVAVLFHDLGKGTTPEDVLPHHYKHEERSFDLVKALMEKHRFPKKVKEFSILFAQQHMRMNVIEELTARKLVKYLLSIPKHFHADFLIAAKSDTSSPERPGVEEFGVALFEAASDVVVHTKFEAFPKEWNAERIRNTVHSTRVSALKRRVTVLRES